MSDIVEAMSCTNEFEAFWNEYPRCFRKTNKPGAKAAFVRARVKFGVSFEDIMGGLRRYRFSTDPQYIPLPTTWINQARWEVDDDGGFDPCLRAAGLGPEDFNLI